MKESLRECFPAFIKLICGTCCYVLYRAKKKETERYCHICEVNGRPLARVSYMIRTGIRKGSDEDAEATVHEVMVCNCHHPDKDVAGAHLAFETQNFLLRSNASTACVYFYRVPEHIFRLG